MAVVVLFVEKYSPVFPAAVVSSFAWQLHPLAAVNPVAPFIVMTTVQLFAPIVNLPADAPPAVELIEVQPVAVNFVPPDSKATAANVPVAPATVLVQLAALSIPITPAVPARQRIESAEDPAFCMLENPRK